MNYFSTNLKYLREKAKMNKSELAQKINISQATLSRWENEKMGATVDNALDISNYFGVSMADLLGTDLRIQQASESEYEVLYKKYKDILTEEDLETMKFLIQKRIREIDKQNNNE